MFVEDEDPLRRAVVKMLRRAGLSVIEAIDGFAAIEAIRTPTSTIDVLVLDMTVPGTPSREVFEEAKRLRPDVGLIVTSAFGEDVVPGFCCRVVDIFPKRPAPSPTSG